MRGASSEPPPPPPPLLQREPDWDRQNQPPYYRFTRQPVKYHRHHNPAARLASAGRALRAAADSEPGSGDSSRSSSPEHSERPFVPPSPCQVAQFMLGLDTPGAQGAGPRPRPSGGQSHGSTGRTLPAETEPKSPAQKILSGLKLRRSHSGKEEQLFV